MLTKIEKFTLGFTISSFVLVFLLGSQGLILTPLFTIDVEQPSNTNVTIKNVGMTQAKNTVIHILSNKPLNMTNSICLEESNIITNENQITLYLDRFSTGISCNLNFDGRVQYDLQYITVSSDDSRGLEWTPFGDMMYKFTLVMIGLYSTIAVIIATIVGTITSTYLRKQRKNTVDKFKTKDKKLLEEIKDSEEELNTLQKMLSTTTHPKVFTALSQRIQSLDEHIRSLNNESAKLKSSISLEGKFEEKIGMFFISWAEIEQQLNRIASKMEMDPIMTSPNNLIRQLSTKEVISKEMVATFNEIRQFRNGVVHGFISPNDSEISEEIMKVKKFLEELKNIQS